MVGGLIATDVLLMVVGLLIILLAMGVGVWVWLRRAKPLSRKQQD